ncbi:Ssra-binding protein [Thalictrum thalictroides]|uniref:Ssra-binding protein n=1 Tax=Thalictrum thalictroides TaxID=46969 RepID=A0A7J6W276_THATH|nr:Ssra-binding protein [Thalictrum thalictroides]
MASWVRTITSPFRKARTFFNPNSTRDTKKSQQEHDHHRAMALHGEVMACTYEDVQVMWSMLDKSKAVCN